MVNDTFTPAARPPWRFLVFNFLLSRVWLFVVAGVGALVIAKGPFYRHPHSVLDWFNHWDAGWYLSIVRGGYGYEPGKQCSVAFFPLYPLLVRLGTLGGAVDARLMGYLVSNSALLAAVVVLWKLAVLETGDAAAAGRTVRFLLLTPVTVFFSSIYSESLFLLGLVSTLYFARTQRWLLAGLCGYAAALTRVVGLLVVVPLVWEYFLQRRAAPQPRGREIWKVLVSWVLPGFGLLTYMLYLNHAFGEPLAFLKVQTAWCRSLAWPWVAFYHRGQGFYEIWFVSFAIGALGLFILGMIWKLRSTYLMLLGLLTLICLSSGRLESLPRFLSVMFPFYFILATLTTKWPKLTGPLFAACAVLQGLAVILFVNGYWFT